MKLTLKSTLFFAVIGALSLFHANRASAWELYGVKTTFMYIDDQGNFGGDYMDNVWASGTDSFGNPGPVTAPAQAEYDECTGEWWYV